MIIGVVGLGLIGGSMAKAINQNTGNSVYGFDIDDTVSKKAILVDATEEYSQRIYFRNVICLF